MKGPIMGLFCFYNWEHDLIIGKQNKKFKNF